MTTNLKPIYSTLASDPDYIDLVKGFVSKFPLEAELIRRCLSEKNLVLLQRIMHQLRGSCGGYGFPTLTEYAGQIDERLKTGQTLESVEADITIFLSMLASATAEKA